MEFLKKNYQNGINAQYIYIICVRKMYSLITVSSKIIVNISEFFFFWLGRLIRNRKCELLLKNDFFPHDLKKKNCTY